MVSSGVPRWPLIKWKAELKIAIGRKIFRPDAKDKKRAKYIIDHLRWSHKAIREGVDLKGYLHWSLLDNFEWTSGFSQKFGLIEMDFDTLEVKIRLSALEYAKICKNNYLMV